MELIALFPACRASGTVGQWESPKRPEPLKLALGLALGKEHS